ncbi:hypothetical protein P692DRAFT_20877490 [Suillus brevipes Sb2]|nr:hypothetical protein P692DRAFT_20877490 [Suillus brevipes Sb2]
MPLISQLPPSNTSNIQVSSYNALRHHYCTARTLPLQSGPLLQSCIVRLACSITAFIMEKTVNVGSIQRRAPRDLPPSEALLSMPSSHHFRATTRNNVLQQSSAIWQPTSHVDIAGFEFKNINIIRYIAHIGLHRLLFAFGVGLASAYATPDPLRALTSHVLLSETMSRSQVARDVVFSVTSPRHLAPYCPPHLY